jgi:hypothetical protein
VSASAERVLIEIEDECGGLTDANHDDLFRPFEQRSRDRTGLGLGLAFSRWGVEASHGRIYARNLPERGCVFTVDLPRLAEPELAMNVDSESRPRLVASIVQDDAEQGVVDPDRPLAFVLNEAQLPELVQEIPWERATSSATSIRRPAASQI